MRSQRLCQIILVCSWMFLTIDGNYVRGNLVFRSQQYKYNLSFPDGWIRVPDADVQKIVQRISTFSKGSFFEAAFQRIETSSFPNSYVMIQVIPYPSQQEPSLAEIRQLISSMQGTKPSAIKKYLTTEASSLFREIPVVASANFDETLRRYTINMQCQVEGIGPMISYIKGFVGHKSIVQVMGSSRQSDFASLQPHFDQIFDTFQYDLDAMFQGTTPSPSSWRGAMENAFTWLVLAAIVGFGLLRMKSRKITENSIGKKCDGYLSKGRKTSTTD